VKRSTRPPGRAGPRVSPPTPGPAPPPGTPGPRGWRHLHLVALGGLQGLVQAVQGLRAEVGPDLGQDPLLPPLGGQRGSPARNSSG
jgi:hypothetical protein